jgi:hypothetical protein
MLHARSRFALEQLLEITGLLHGHRDRVDRERVDVLLQAIGHGKRDAAQLHQEAGIMFLELLGVLAGYELDRLESYAGGERNLTKGSTLFQQYQDRLMLLGWQPCERVSTMAALFVCYGFNLLI